MIDFLTLDNTISDEMLAAYIDGNATSSESEMIQNVLGSDELLSETIEIVHDSVSLGNDHWNSSFDNLEIFDLGISSIVPSTNILPTNDPLFGNENTFENIDFGVVADVHCPTSDDELAADNNQEQPDNLITDYNSYHPDDTNSWQNIDDTNNFETLTY